MIECCERCDMPADELHLDHEPETCTRVLLGFCDCPSVCEACCQECAMKAVV